MDRPDGSACRKCRARRRPWLRSVRPRREAARRERSVRRLPRPTRDEIVQGANRRAARDRHASRARHRRLVEHNHCDQAMAAPERAHGPRMPSMHGHRRDAGSTRSPAARLGDFELHGFFGVFSRVPPRSPREHGRTGGSGAIERGLRRQERLRLERCGQKRSAPVTRTRGRNKLVQGASVARQASL